MLVGFRKRKSSLTSSRDRRSRNNGRSKTARRRREYSSSSRLWDSSAEPARNLRRLGTLLHSRNLLSRCPKYISFIAAKRQIEPAPGILVLNHLSRIVQVVDNELYEEYESSARDRMVSRDVDDWPIVATSLLLKCPVWTEDRNFFGSGISTWTTEAIELYLRDT